jgi:osmotically-inducible protein OsmY
VNSLQEDITGLLEVANVERAATSRLERTAYGALKAVKCRFRQGTLLLNGSVPTYFHKQLAQESVRGLRGVTEIKNQVCVCHDAWQCAGRGSHGSHGN